MAVVYRTQYPEEIRKLKPDWNFGIRGLHLDITNVSLFLAGATVISSCLVF